MHTDGSKDNVMHFRHCELKGRLAPPALSVTETCEPPTFTSFAYLYTETRDVCFRDFLYIFLSKVELTCCLTPQQPVKSQGLALVTLFSHVTSIHQSAWPIGSAQSIG